MRITTKQHLSLLFTLASTFVALNSAQAQENNFAKETYVANESGYCADIYRKDGVSFSNNKTHIYLKNDSGDSIPKNHPKLLKVDFYKNDSRDSSNATVPCHGELFKKGTKPLNVNLLITAITADDVG